MSPAFNRTFTSFLISCALLCPAAHASDGVATTVTNDDTDHILVIKGA